MIYNFYTLGDFSKTDQMCSALKCFTDLIQHKTEIVKEWKYRPMGQPCIHNDTRVFDSNMTTLLQTSLLKEDWWYRTQAGKRHRSSNSACVYSTGCFHLKRSSSAHFWIDLYSSREKLGLQYYPHPYLWDTDLVLTLGGQSLMWYKQSGFVNSTPTSVKKHLSTEQGMLYHEYPCNCKVC